MSRLKIGIGITTYADLAVSEMGSAVYDAYAAVSALITPNQIRTPMDRDKHVVEGRDDFVAHWVTTAELSTWANRGKGERLSYEEIALGAEWRRTGSLPGEGRIDLRSPMSKTDSNCVFISHTYSARVDWMALFRRLTEIICPSHAMLHLFTPEETQLYVVGEGVERFDQPFAHEFLFTGRRYPNGLRQRPAQWETEERRTYRYLPELTWAVVLGPEFAGQYDPEVIRRFGHDVAIDERGARFTVTPKLADMETDPAGFQAARRRLRSAFPDWAFERP